MAVRSLTGSNRLDSKTLKPWSIVALIGLGGQGILFVALHFLSTEFDSTVNFVSEYSLGRFAWLMAAANLFGITGKIALLGALHTAGIAPLRSLIGGLMTVHILALVLVLVFPIDSIEQAFADGDGPNFTTSGWIHALSGLVASVTMIISAVLITVRIARSGLLMSGYKALIPLCVVAPAAYIAMFATQPGMYPAGLYQRLYLIAIIGWLLIVAYGLFARKFGGASRVTEGV